jgi:hypothetical protein
LRNNEARREPFPGHREDGYKKIIRSMSRRTESDRGIGFGEMNGHHAQYPRGGNAEMREQEVMSSCNPIAESSDLEVQVGSIMT